MEVDRYELVLLLGGLAALAAAWLPAYLSRRPLSLPLALVLLGVGMFALPLGLAAPHPQDHPQLTERLTELGVIVALMGAGLKIDRPLGWRSWGSTWRMLAIAMPLTIAVVALLGGWLLDLGVAEAVLLGAVLAPTDPVLAADVQVGEPTVEGSEEEEHETTEDEVRFTLTSEGGLNDALAFPFVYLAVRLLEDGTDPSDWLVPWLGLDVVYRLGAGVVVGIAVGWLLGLVLFRPPGRLSPLADSAHGFVAVAATLLAYGATELVHGYGFLAVFVAALTIRSSERRHEVHRILHDFTDQAEQLFIVGMLVALGGALVGGILDPLGLAGLAVVALLLLVVRPLAGAVSLLGSRGTVAEHWAIAGFGVRGIGSAYYLAYAAGHHDLAHGELLWAVTAAAIVGSVVLHGVTATPVMAHLDRRRRHRHRVRT